MFITILSVVLHFYASWLTPNSTVVSWYQTERTCLYYASPTQAAVALECYDQVNTTIRVTIGAVGPLDAAYRPQKDGVYTLVTDSGEHSSTMVKWRTFLPVVR